MKIRKDDKVVVLSGRDKGKEGKVLSADPKNGKVIVEGVLVASRHQKPRKQGEEGGIIQRWSARSAASPPAWVTPLSTAKRCAPARSAAPLSERGE